jgi:hypothetical protein
MTRWPRQWQQRFVLGFFGVIMLESVVDQFVEPPWVRRVVEAWMVGAYGLGWLAVWWWRPDFFDE